MTADAVRRARVREAVGSTVQYALLFGFAAVAAAISAHGLVGFARANMGLAGPWPYLLWGALDGAAGLCVVLLMRRAARGESALAPQLAVWGLVAASSMFNWTHAPQRPGAREAFALMPVMAAVLFEFSLRETRHSARRAERRLTGLGWLPNQQWPGRHSTCRWRAHGYPRRGVRRLCGGPGAMCTARPQNLPRIVTAPRVLRCSRSGGVAVGGR